MLIRYLLINISGIISSIYQLLSIYEYSSRRVYILIFENQIKHLIVPIIIRYYERPKKHLKLRHQIFKEVEEIEGYLIAWSHAPSGPKWEANQRNSILMQILKTCLIISVILVLSIISTIELSAYFSSLLLLPNNCKLAVY